jgi:hypothetical protein
MIADWNCYNESPYMPVYNQIFSRYKSPSAQVDKVEFLEKSLASICHLHQ